MKTINNNNYGTNYINNNASNIKSKNCKNDINFYANKERGSTKNISSINSQINRYNNENEINYDIHNKKSSSYRNPNHRFSDYGYNPKNFIPVLSQNETPTAEIELMKKRMSAKNGSIDTLGRNVSNDSLNKKNSKGQKFLKDSIQVLDTINKNLKESSGEKLTSNILKNSI